MKSEVKSFGSGELLAEVGLVYNTSNLPTLEQAKQVFDYIPTSQGTRDDYKARIGDFVEFVAINGLNFDTLLEYRKHLEARTDYSVSTKNKYFATAKRYVGVLYTTGIIPKDISKDISGVDIKGFKQDKKHKKDGVSADEMERLAKYFRSLPDTPENRRLKAIFALFIYQGLRQVEIARLDVTDIDLRSNKIFIRGKGRDDKEPVALHPHTAEALKAYLSAYNKKSGALFTSQSHNANGERLTTRSIRSFVEKVFGMLDIPNSAHGFRHYFTTSLIKSYGGDLLAVAHYTRHRSLEMLQVYNDQLKAEEDLPRYISVFEGVQL